MSLENSDVIDIVAQREDVNGQKIILLVISAFCNWGEGTDEIKNQLSKKVGNYAAYIRGDDYAKQFGSAKAEIMLMASYSLTDEISEFLSHLSRIIGIPISVKQS